MGCANNYAEALNNYLNMAEVVKAAQVLVDNDYDIDDTWDIIQEEWQTTCQSMLEYLMDINSDILRRLKEG